MTQITPWEVIPHTGVSELPKLLHEIVVKDFTLPLVGDYKGVIVAFVAGAYWDDPEARALAEQNAALIASAPALRATIVKLAERSIYDALIVLMDDGAADASAATLAGVWRDLRGAGFTDAEIATLMHQQHALALQVGDDHAEFQSVWNLNPDAMLIAIDALT